MATPRGGADPPLERTLFEEPYRFDFFQAVRLLERLQPGRAAVGRDGPPAREVVRFLARPGFVFPASAIDGLVTPEGSESAPAMTVNFLGLTGPSGVLPHVYTELVQTRQRAGDSALAAFLDLFNHRLLSLFYRAWEKHRVAAGAAEGEGDDQFEGHLFALLGLGLRPLRNRHSFPDRALPTYAGFFARRHRPAVVLEELLRDYFGLPMEVVQFSGQWLRLTPGDLSTLARRGANNALGVSLVVGSRVWDEQGKIRLRLGPLSFAEFRAYLPDGPGFRALVEMTRLFVDAEFDLDVQLVLKADEVPRCHLSSRPGAGARLGRFAWVGARRPARDVDNAVFRAPV
jgi:type VI secretion system protein ImpH